MKYFINNNWPWLSLALLAVAGYYLLLNIGDVLWVLSTPIVKLMGGN